MARIRSIKPDFFTSETICALPLSTRLTFIGLWTHVDDNGVTVDNAKLIMAAIWPLEDDPRETLARTLEDLRRLSAAGLIVRYETSGKRLLFVAGWDEHQKVSHPGKARYPRPPEGYVTWEDPDPPETLARPSGESPEILRPEQGAGSREQGAGTAIAVVRETRSTKRATRIPEGFAVTPEMVAWAAERTPYVDGRIETEKFINYWRSKSGSAATKLDWVATWRNWMLTAAERTPTGRASPGRSGDIDWNAAMQRAAAREANAS